MPWLVPLPEGLLHPEERGAVVLDRDGGRIATLPGPDYYHTEPVPVSYTHLYCHYKHLLVV